MDFRDYFKKHQKKSSNECALTCLDLVSQHYNLNITYTTLKKNLLIEEDGVSMYNLNVAAKKIGFKTLMLDLPYEKISYLTLPFIAFINENHFVVVCDIFTDGVEIADPSFHKTCKLTRDEFISRWVKKRGEKSFGKVLSLDL